MWKRYDATTQLSSFCASMDSFPDCSGPQYGYCTIAPAAGSSVLTLRWRAGRLGSLWASVQFCIAAMVPTQSPEVPVVPRRVHCLHCPCVCLPFLRSFHFFFFLPLALPSPSPSLSSSSPPSRVILRARLARDRPHHCIDDEDRLSCCVTEEETRYTKKITQDKGIDPISRLDRRFGASTTPPHTIIKQGERRIILHGSAALYNNPASPYDKEKTTNHHVHKHHSQSSPSSRSRIVAWHINHRLSRFDQTLKLAQQWFCAAQSLLHPIS